jgi:hypothetical protein
LLSIGGVQATANDTKPNKQTEAIHRNIFFLLLQEHHDSFIEQREKMQNAYHLPNAQENTTDSREIQKQVVAREERETDLFSNI